MAGYYRFNQTGAQIEAILKMQNTLSTKFNEAVSTSNNIKQDIDRIKEYIPTDTSQDNKLVNQDYVNEQINQMSAFYITSNAAGARFTSVEDLKDAQTLYSGGIPRVPTKNDYAIVEDTQEGSTIIYRYYYPGDEGTYQGTKWVMQYAINTSAFTSSQMAAMNSGITKDMIPKNTSGNNPLINSIGSPYVQRNFNSANKIRVYAVDSNNLDSFVTVDVDGNEKAGLVMRDENGYSYSQCNLNNVESWLSNKKDRLLVNYEFINAITTSQGLSSGYPNIKGRYLGHTCFLNNSVFICKDLNENGPEGWIKLQGASST